MISLPFYFQASRCRLPSQPSTSSFLSACARGGLVIYLSATWVSMRCVSWWAFSPEVTWCACTCTRACWPRPCSPHTACGPGKTALTNKVWLVCFWLVSKRMNKTNYTELLFGVFLCLQNSICGCFLLTLCRWIKMAITVFFYILVS